MTIEVTWKYLGLLEVSNLWGHVFMQNVILLFLDMSEFKNKNRITFQNLKFIEAGQKKCHPEPCFFLALSKKLVNPHGSHFFFPFAVQMVATEKTFVTTLNHCSGRLVTESGTPRTITCPNVESCASGVMCWVEKKYERHDFLWRVFARDLRQVQTNHRRVYIQVRLSLNDQ